MTADAWITLIVLIATFAFLALDRVPAAAGLGIAVGVLLLTGVITESQALSGLSSSAPITIAALYVLAGAATVTGAFAPIIDRILGGRSDQATPSGQRGRLLRLGMAAAAMSAVLPNTPLVALVAPRVVTWSRRSGLSASTFLMPLSFAAMLGGVVTVIGTSTNLVVSDLLVASGEEPLGIFEITPVGLPVAIVGLVILVVLAPVLLRGRIAARPDPADGAGRYSIAMRVDADGPLVGNTIESGGLRHLQGVFLVGVDRGDRLVTARPETVLGAGDVCYFAGDVADVMDLIEVRGLTLDEDHHMRGAGERPDAGLYEVVVSERSELVGTTLKDIGFRARYDAAVIAIRRHDDDLPGKLGAITLRGGDVLLVLATPEFSRQWRGHRDFSVIASVDDVAPVRRGNSWMVVVAIGAMIVLAVSGLLGLMEAALLVAGGLMAFRVISVTEARRSVNFNVVLTIAMSISLGTAVAVSGLAAEIADLLGNLGEPFGDTGTIVAILAATMVLTELLSNNAAAAVMFPVAFVAAAEAGLDPRALALVVLIGASCSFLSPIGYQTNLMVYGLGGYRFSDFSRLGAPITLATLIVTPIILPLVVNLRV